VIRRVLRRLFPGHCQAADERVVLLSSGGLDYDRIARLERELGIGDVEPERLVRRTPSVCLLKDCAGETTEIRTWSGTLARRIHRCERP